jgi:hypothetical protein
MATSRLQIVDIYGVSCNFTIGAGWSLISVPCFEDTPSVSSGLRTLYQNFTNATPEGIPNYESVHAFDAFDAPDPWKAFKPGLPDYVVVDLPNLTAEQGYFIRMSSSDRLEYDGRVALPNYVYLVDGANLVGFPINDTNTSRPVPFATQSIGSSLTNVYRLVAGSWQKYNATYQDFVNLTPYEGYWFVMIDNGTWVIDW